MKDEEIIPDKNMRIDPSLFARLEAVREAMRKERKSPKKVTWYDCFTQMINERKEYLKWKRQQLKTSS